jgi:hypothetical protein
MHVDMKKAVTFNVQQTTRPCHHKPQAQQPSAPLTHTGIGIMDLGEIYRGLIFWACIGLHMVVLLWHVLAGGLMLGCFQLSKPPMPVSYTIL